MVEYELADRQVVVHFGWPLSSWLDRLAVGVMVFNLMRLPRMFPQFEFDIQYFRRPKAIGGLSRRPARVSPSCPARLELAGNNHLREVIFSKK